MKDRDKDNILNKIKISGPGFTVPESYFNENDSDDLSIKVKHSEELENGSKLNSNSSKIGTGFTVPKDYFKDFKVNTLEVKEPKVIPLKNNVIKMISFVAAASVILFFGINFMNSNQSVTEQMVIQDEEFAAWIESELADIDSYELAEAFNDIELDHDFYAEEDIDEYLNDIDIEDLILENR